MSSLDLLDTLTASQVIASNLYTQTETDELLANLNSNNNDLDSKQDIITPTTSLSCGTLIVTSPVDKGFTTGTSASKLEIQHGHHLDSYYNNNVGRSLWLQYFSNSDIRIGRYTSKLGINTEATYNLHVLGNAYISTTLNIGGDFTAPNIYNKSEVDSLLSSYAPTVADRSLIIAKTEGLNDILY